MFRRKAALVLLFIFLSSPFTTNAQQPSPSPSSGPAPGGRLETGSNNNGGICLQRGNEGRKTAT